MDMVRIASAFGFVLVAALGLAGPAAAGDQWRQLHRPLDLPQLPAGDACPVSPIDERVDWERINIFGGSGTGPGPVYPGLGADGHLLTSAISQDGWFRGKVFWYAKPSYRGPALIRGRRLDGPGSIHFAASGDRGARPRELRIKRHEEVSWNGQPPGSRGRPSRLSIQSPGCYGVQVDGTRFSRTVVFTASPRN